MTAVSTRLASIAWRALETVLDPELDRSITELDFVAAFDVQGTEVRVDLRLPTYFCAPNFAYLMVADAYDALVAIPGVDTVRVRLLDHFASEEINAGVAAGEGFDSAFPGLAAGELDDLRVTFLRKAHAACQERIASGLLRAGYTHDELVGLRLDDLADGEVGPLRQRRERLALPAGNDAPVVVDDDGQAVEVGALPVRLRFARTTRIGIEANTGWCLGLLATRYDDAKDVDPIPSRA